MLASPKTATHHYYLGNLYLEQAKPEKAIKAYLASLDSGYAKAKVYNNLGIAQKNLDQFDQAEKSFKKAIELDPFLVEAYNNLGNIQISMGRYDNAIVSFRKALKINPYYKDIYNNLGTIWHHLGLTQKAISYYKKAIEVSSTFPDAYNNLGVALHNQSRLKSAVKAFEKAITLRPNFAEAHYNLGSVYHDMFRPEDAIKHANLALSVFPHYQDALHLCIQQNEALCNWEEVERLMPMLNRMTKDAIDNNYKPGEIPLFSISNFDDPQRNYQVAKLWSEHSRKLLPQAKPFSFHPKKVNSPLKVGYLSSDFRDNVISHQFVDVFKFHDKKKFKIYAYSAGPNDRSYYRNLIEKNSIFKDISQTPFADAAEMIYKDKIDILVDLNGYTRGAKLEVSALKPAPVQAHYLGFPGSMGSDIFDYILTDQVITPPDMAKYYSEKFVFLPDCYQAQSYLKFNKNKKDSLPESQKDSSFIFCSFNNNYKITEPVFETWMRILNKVPGSALWLVKEFPTTQKNLLREAERRGISSERIIFSQRLSLEKHLQRLSLADLALDTYPYNGGATTSNALWAGVPVVSMQGTTYLSRMSSSLLTAAGLPELITTNLTSYEDLAVSLAKNYKKLTNLKLKLIKNRDTKPLFNTESFTRNLEKAYEKMWNIHMSGKKPGQIVV